MRIGTWNLAGKWTPEHAQFIERADCDVWLLTEVSDRGDLADYQGHLTAGLMATRRRWAGVFSRRRLTPVTDPHAVSAAAIIDGVTYCSSILPWRGCSGSPTWIGTRHADRTGNAVAGLARSLFPCELIWGGDCNHALSGRECAGSAAGRQHIVAALDLLGLQVPTKDLPHRIEGLLSIDHIAVARSRTVVAAYRLAADGISDHDGYVVEVTQ
jgi:hypothetical protein